MSNDLISRLRCKYPNGPIMENGEPEFGYRDYSGEFNGVMLPSPIMLEAADRISDLERRNGELEEALTDMLSGWKYIRETHGDLYGVGWDRAQNNAEAALTRTKEQG